MPLQFILVYCVCAIKPLSSESFSAFGNVPLKRVLSYIFFASQFAFFGCLLCHLVISYINGNRLNETVNNRKWAVLPSNSAFWVAFRNLCAILWWFSFFVEWSLSQSFSIFVWVKNFRPFSHLRLFSAEECDCTCAAKCIGPIRGRISTWKIISPKIFH